MFDALSLSVSAIVSCAWESLLLAAPTVVVGKPLWTSLGVDHITLFSIRRLSLTPTLLLHLVTHQLTWLPFMGGGPASCLDESLGQGFRRRLIGGKGLQ